MLECIICSKDCMDEYYVKCELCSYCTHIICLHEAKAIKSKFPNGNSPPKYICEILSSSYFVFKCTNVLIYLWRIHHMIIMSMIIYQKY